MTPDICIYHSPCVDGFTAAWAIRQRWPDIEFYPGVHGESPPDVTGKNVLFVDFSYKQPVLLKMAEQANHIVVLDHHKSAMEDLRPFNCEEIKGEPLEFADGCKYCLEAKFDMDRSGALLAWEYAFPDVPAPSLVRHVSDRDLWKFDLPGTREINADLFSMPYDFDVYSRFAEELETATGRTIHLVSGEAIERKHHKDVEELLAFCTREMVIGGYSVKVANMPYTMASDAASILSKDGPFGACYYDAANGDRVFSLRSRGGFDVSKVAAFYGGGGHAAASGFRMPRGWEGE